MASDRFGNTVKNALYSYVNQFIFIILGLVSRYVFIEYLGSDYLGANGLFTNILGVLSLSELGVGAALGVALYKPLAEKDTEKVKSIMYLYKRAYFFIGCFIGTIGLALVPLLPVLVNNTTGLTNLHIYYVLFLINTVISYLLGYKSTLIIQDQKEYKLTKLRTIIGMLKVLFQIIVIIMFHNYLRYLICELLCNIVLRVADAWCVDNEYPYIKDRDVKKLDESEVKGIIKNIKALLVHKLGDVSINQTDNIILSSFLSLEITGVVSNFVLFKTYAFTIINTVLSAATPSIGNLIVKESDETKISFFKIYRLLSYWLFGWASLGFIFLSNPLLDLIFGKEYTLPNIVVFLMGLVMFTDGEGTPMFNYKGAAGIFNEDKYVSFFSSIINIVVSVAGVKLVGISGVYIGTLVCRFFSISVRCYIVYRKAFRSEWLSVYSGIIKYVLFFTITYIACAGLFTLVNIAPLADFIIKTIIMVIVPNIVFVMLYCKSNEFKYYISIINNILNSLKNKIRI